MDRCVVKNCTFSLVLNNLFGSPEDKELLKQWQKAVDTNLVEFYVCDQHFAKKDLIVERNLKKNSVPSLNLNDVIIKLENDCCGFCLDKLEVKHEIQQQFTNYFKEICGYEPLTNFMCRDCKYGLLKYKKFKTEIQKKHEDIRKEAKRPKDPFAMEVCNERPKKIVNERSKPVTQSIFDDKSDSDECVIVEEGKIPETLNLVEVEVPKGIKLPVPQATLDAIYKSYKLNQKLVEKIKKDLVRPKNDDVKNVQENPKNDSQAPSTSFSIDLNFSDEPLRLLPRATLKSSRKSALIPKTDSQLITEHALIIACEFCFKEMGENELEAHIKKKHTEKITLLCEVCSKEFKDARQFRYHVRGHYPDQMFSCDECGRKFVRKNVLVNHMKKHLGIIDERFKCKICLKVVGQYRRHKFEHMKMYHPKGYDCGARVNSETNYFDCTQCGASYADLFTYRRHDCEKGRYQLRCPDCQKPIRNAEKMRIHQANGCKTIDPVSGNFYYWKGARFKKK